MKKILRKTIPILFVISMLFIVTIDTYSLDKEVNEEVLTQERTIDLEEELDKEILKTAEVMQDEVIVEAESMPEEIVEEAEIMPEEIVEETETMPEEIIEEAEIMPEAAIEITIEAADTKPEEANEMEGLKYDKRFDPDITLPNLMKFEPTSSITDTIAVNKTAVRSPGCRMFEVTLDITGTPQEAPVDVVLVIDRSGSMNDKVGGTSSNSRLFYAKQAAVNFAGRVLGNNGIPGSRVSVVSFSGPTTTTSNGNQNQASTDLDLSSNLTTVESTINAITAVGGTNTEAGFKQGQSVIQGATSSQNPNSNKVVIMLTDGLPTASNGNRYQETTDINHIHIQRAISAGKYIFQNNIADVFTIGITTGMNATEKALADNILTQAQNKGYYPAPSATDLDAIFDAISQSLGYAAQNAKVVDKIGDDFELVVSSLPSGATYNAATREISWDAGTIVNAEQLKYTVVAKSTFAGGPADTNEYATLTYKDIFGTAGKTKTFPVPNVNVPTLLEVSLTDATINSGDSIDLGIETDSSGPNYMSPITGGDGNGNFTYEWRKVGSSTVISTAKHPTVNLTDDTEYELKVKDSNGCIAVATMKVTVKQFTEFTVTKVWQGGSTLDRPTVKFELYRNIDGEEAVLYRAAETLSGTTHTWSELELTDEDGNLYIYSFKELAVDNYDISYDGNTVTNTYKSPTTGTFTAKKVWDGGPANDRPEVKFQLYRNIAGGTPVTYRGEEVLSGLTHTWNNLELTDEEGNNYIYSFKELGIPNYTQEMSEDGLTVTNTYKSPKINVTGYKVWLGESENPRPDIELQLYRNGIALPGEVVTLTSGVTFHEWVGLDEKDSSGVDYIYAVDEVDVPDNYVKTELEVLTLTVTNTYTLGSLEITKVDGDTGAIVTTGAEFDLLDSNGVVIAHGITAVDGKFLFDNLPIGNYTLVETKAPTYTDEDGNEVTYGLLAAPIDVEISKTGEAVEITVENYKPGWELPPTGGRGPVVYFSLGTLFMMAAVIMRIKKKQSSDLTE